MREGKQNKPPIENNKIKDKDSLKNQKGFNKMKNTASTANVRFTIDFIKKTITGTTASYNKASKGSGPIYEELAAKMAAHPDFTLVKKEPKSNKARQVYKGMDIDFMRDYIKAKKDPAFEEKFEKVLTFAENSKKSKYPIAKKFFLKQYKDFKYDAAKVLVENYRVNNTQNGIVYFLNPFTRIVSSVNSHEAILLLNTISSIICSPHS